VPVAGRRLLIAVELYRREHGRSPIWWELRTALGLSHDEMTELAWALRRNGLIIFTRETRSLRVTPAGLRAALGKERR
jgi:hypothetical protein